MYAEIRITVVDGLSPGLDAHARGWFAPTVAPAAALARADLEVTHGDVENALVAKLPPAHATILWREDAVTLRAHVQLTTKKPKLSSLKEIAEETACDVGKFLRAHGTNVADVTIRIYAEGEHLQTGRRFTWRDRMVASARKEVAGRLSVPLATFLVSLWLDSDVPKAIHSALAGFVGVLAWLLVSATLEKPGYRYE